MRKNLKGNKNYSSDNRLILKSADRKILHEELYDSLNYVKERSGLQLKLDNMIKENNELKNQIYDNKNIEEKLKKLLVENKKNQNINAIIMKDNQQLAKKLKNIQDNKNYQLVIQNQSSLDLSQDDIQIQSHSSIKLKKLYIKCLVLKKTLKNRNILEAYFNKYKNINNIKNEKPDKTTIENNNIFINNRKNINIQMTKNFNINFISQKDNYKHFILDKLFMKKEEIKKKTLLKYFYKFIFISKYLKIFEGIKDKDKSKDKPKEKEINEEKKINEIKIKEEKEEDESELKRNKLQSIINKYERNYNILFRNSFKEWKLRGVIVKMKSIAKAIKKKKKLKKKIREKIAKANLKNLKNKTANFQSAHEFSYNIDKTKQDEEKIQNNNETDENNKKGANDNLGEIKEENKDGDNENTKKNNNISYKNNNNENIIEEQDNSESSFGLDD